MLRMYRLVAYALELQEAYQSRATENRWSWNP